MNDIWDPLGEAKGCLNFFSACLIYAIVAAMLFGFAMAFVTGVQFGRWENLRYSAALVLLAVLLIPWMVHGILRGKEWYRIFWEVLGVGLTMIILSAAFFPSFPAPSNRGRQKRTMTDMRVIANKMDAFHEKQGVYPAFNDLVNFGKFFRFKAPARDGWNHPLVFKATDKDYWVISYGRDGKPDSSDIGAYREQPTASFDNDLVLHNGRFLHYPEGTIPSK